MGACALQVDFIMPQFYNGVTRCVGPTLSRRVYSPTRSLCAGPSAHCCASFLCDCHAAIAANDISCIHIAVV